MLRKIYETLLIRELNMALGLMAKNGISLMKRG